MVPGRNLGGWSCPSTAPRIFLCSTGGPCVPGTPLREQHWAGEPPASRHSTATQAAAPSPAPSPHGTWSCNKATEQPSGPRAYLLTYSDLERALELWPPRLTCFSIRCSMRSCISRFCKGREGRLAKGSWDAKHLLGSRGLGSTAPLSLALGRVFPREMKPSPTKGGQGICVGPENLEAHPCHLSSWYRQPDPLSAWVHRGLCSHCPHAELSEVSHQGGKKMLELLTQARFLSKKGEKFDTCYNPRGRNAILISDTHAVNCSFVGKKGLAARETCLLRLFWTPLELTAAPAAPASLGAPTPASRTSTALGAARGTFSKAKRSTARTYLSLQVSDLLLELLDHSIFGLNHRFGVLELKKKRTFAVAKNPFHICLGHSSAEEGGQLSQPSCLQTPTTLTPRSA